MGEEIFIPHEYDVFAGLDVSKKSIAATFTSRQGFIRSLQMPHKTNHLLNHVRKHFAGQKIAFVYEAGPTGYALYDGLAAEGGYNLADDAEGRHDHHVDLGMAEKPKQMLIEDWIATRFRSEKARPEIAVGQKHGNRTSQRGQRQHHHEGGDQNRQYEKRHAVHGHARRPHVEDGRDHIDSADDRRGTGQVQS